MNRLLTFTICLMSITMTHADVVLDTLVSRGNRAYAYSQPTKIKLYADSIATILNSGAIKGDVLKDYMVSMLKLYGNYHYETAELDSAERYYNRARAIIAENQKTNFHGNDLLMLRELAQLFYRQARYDEAVAVMSETNDRLEYNTPYLIGDKDWLITKLTYAICLARVKRFDEALQIAHIELKNALDKTNLDYAKAQRMYAKILLLADTDKTGALTAYKAYFKKQRDEAMQNFTTMNATERQYYWQTLRPFIADCYLLESADPGFLYNVTLFAKGLLLQVSRLSAEGSPSEKALKSLGYTWLDIQKRLKKGEAAIEFIQYDKHCTQQMAALLLKSTGKPQFIPLTSPDEILSIAGKALQTTDRTGKDRLYSDEVLSAKIWTRHLLSSLVGVKNLYFAPDGYMHRLAIEYMPQVKAMDMHRLTSTRRLMETSSFDSQSAMLLFGGINYDLDKASGVVDENDISAFFNYQGSRFPRLSESSNEAIEIFNSRKNTTDTLLLASSASEKNFRTLAPNYSSILVSTHGDFCSKTPVATDLKPALGDSEMSQNIMAFAGVNSHLLDNSQNYSLTTDGLLSAKELASLNLSKCELFTISACQSALGEISADGVFGLQRGLKNAGVDAMLLSLWNVNSEATAMLMREFYSRLSTGEPMTSAWKNARQKLFDSEKVIIGNGYIFDPATMSNVPATTTSSAFNTPQYTNAFILIDAIN